MFVGRDQTSIAAVVGYNPKKPGRPSPSRALVARENIACVYHIYTIAGLRLVLDVEVSPGNEHASKYAAPGLWALVDRIPHDCWPAFLRGDSGFGTETIMREAELRGLHYLLKLRLTPNVKKLIKKTFSKSDWSDAGAALAGRDQINIAAGVAGPVRDAAAGRLEPPASGGDPAPPSEGRNVRCRTRCHGPDDAQLC